MMLMIFIIIMDPHKEEKIFYGKLILEEFNMYHFINRGMVKYYLKEAQMIKYDIQSRNI